MKKFIIFTIICACILCIGISASDKISPAIDVIATENEMIKTGILQNGEIVFDTYDFDTSLGANVKSITICSLPSETEGRLMLGNLYVVENQVIFREDFSLLKFVSANTEESASVFYFEPNNSGYEIACSLKTTKSVNFSPVASNGDVISTWTQENISNYGTLSGYDPDGDELKFEIVNYPKKGLVTLTNTTTGDYKYTPYLDAKGTDAFSYRVMDSYGNYSETCTVSIKIDKLRVSLVFNDIENDKYLNAVLVMKEFDIMECTENKDGSFSFNPNEIVTKEEFVYLVMLTMGAKNVPTLDVTRFADNDDIAPEYRGYIEAAISLGIITGTNEADGLHFNPKKEIATAEAAVIINKIIGAKATNDAKAFSDEKDIPSYAKEALNALNSIGIIATENGKINPNSPLSRSQTAQILMSLLQYRGKLN
ncbi:MAG: S-layer homology domain-containing protein [Clostridia bacterium]|nr:S-layer homology domain-containing protein [Clostridia bacterium]